MASKEPPLDVQPTELAFKGAFSPSFEHQTHSDTRGGVAAFGGCPLTGQGSGVRRPSRVDGQASVSGAAGKPSICSAKSRVVAES